MRFSNELIDTIIQSCLELYNKLPKTGKPLEVEWTVLSCIVQYDNISGKHEVVSLGTGSKCVGANKMSPSGDVLNDSHAEVFARRGFLLYLYEMLTEETTPSIFVLEKGKFKLKENIEFIFYSSQLPCGDASIVPKNSDVEQFGNVLPSKRSAKNDVCDLETKKLKLKTEDIHRTGAKCLPGEEQDLKESGTNYHLLGQVRIKPGRGDRTLSVSCSDKMAKWVHLGVQGSLIDMLLCEPIYISHFIFGAGVPYYEEALKRAFLKRNCDHLAVIQQVPEFYQCSLQYPCIRTENNIKPAPGSIVWVKTKHGLLEVGVQGKKLGLTKKKTNSPNNSLCISKFKMYQKFLEVLIKNKEIKKEILDDEIIENFPYNEMKKKSKRYLEKWVKVKKSFFKTWTKKPDIWNFCLNIT